MAALGLAACDAATSAESPVAIVLTDATSRCASLAAGMRAKWPDASTEVQLHQLVSAGPLPGGPAFNTVTVPEHCELIARLRSRVGALNQTYAIRFHLRLPSRWNGRFFFQGGGGSNGNLGDALGRYSAAAAPALLQGFAVVSQDSGHDNQLNNDPAHAGQLTFGFDAIARSHYGHASLPLVTDAARAAIAHYYEKAPTHSYFVGCSKGGEEALALTQRYADRFDGIVAGAPAMSLPRAAVAEAWDTQALAAAVPLAPGAKLKLADLHRAFTDAELGEVRAAVLAACDKGDQLADGMVGNATACTTAKVIPKLRQRLCSAAKPAPCLREAQLTALLKVMQGPHNSRGQALYSDWAWDPAMATAGWRVWKIGGATGQPASLNVTLGGASLASLFTTPPIALADDPEVLLQFLLRFDFDRDAPKIEATTNEFPQSAWADFSARSTDLDAWRARGGKLIVYHGVADPVFSIHDTIAWWREVNQRYQRGADDFVRLFPVPGMTHCGGGEATSKFDPLAALVRWVEAGQAPDRILASADLDTPWPNRERPLCPYPRIAQLLQGRDPEKAASFVCRSPSVSR